jgi:RNA polymerase sigma factor (sigma-70 family)
VSDAADAGPPVEHLFRREYGRIVAVLTRTFGADRLDAIEDATQEALVVALRQWPQRGVPPNPGGWLFLTARNQLLDALRREATFRRKEPELLRFEPNGTSGNDPAAEVTADDVADDRLRMLFMACHPAIPPEARVALALKTLGGFGATEIARGFLVPEATVAQRLSRAKRTIRERDIAIEFPDAADLEPRVASVLETLALLFTEGHAAARGERAIRDDLCAEAIHLASLLAAHPAGDRPETHALLALMLLQAAHFPARLDANGAPVLLPDQDRTRWDRRLIAVGLTELAAAAKGDRLSVYHLQAEIAACHALAASWAETDWPRILAAYDDLLRVAPSPVVRLNRAVALANVAGPAAGLAELAELARNPALFASPHFQAALGELSRQAGDQHGAASGYRAAIDRAANAAERRSLSARLARIEAGSRP